MKTIGIEYVKKDKMELTPGYIIAWMIGTIVFGVTLMRIDINGFWNVMVGLLLAAGGGFSGAMGKYFFDKKGKKWLDKWLRKKKRP